MISKLKNRRGVSIVEVVVAMTIIVLISGTAMSFIFTSDANADKDVAYTNARLIAENALEIFKHADDAKDYQTIFAQHLKKDGTPSDSTTYSYTYAPGYVTLNIKADYSDNKKIFTAVAKKQNGDELFNIKYEK